MSSGSGENIPDETCQMDVTEDAVVAASCSNQHEGVRSEADDNVEEEDSGGGGGGGEERTLSSASSDSSVAVNCQSYPTEVIVHGRKVQRVRVLFTPFPPRMSTASGPESLNGYPVRRRVASVDRNLTSSDSTGHRHRRYRSSGSTVAQATDDLGALPLSQEETSGCPGEGVGEGTPVVGCVPQRDHKEGGELREAMETKMRREIRNGISFIEDRLAGLIQLNQRLRADLEKETRNGEVMRERAAMTESRLQLAESENNELKQQLDCKEKEAMRLGEQAKEEWRRRIGLEESLMEMKRNKDLESTSLKDQLDARNAEVRTLELELKHRKQVAERSENRADTVEMVARVNQLEETLHRLQREKERVEEVASRLERDLEASKAKHESDHRNLELQMGRFQALKKCYVDLQEENQRLAKTTQRVLRDPDSIRIIDLPDQTKPPVGVSLQSQQHPGHLSLTPNKMAVGRDLRIATRKKSQDSAGSDHCFSLPPVQKFNK